MTADSRESSWLVARAWPTVHGWVCSQTGIPADGGGGARAGAAQECRTAVRSESDHLCVPALTRRPAVPLPVCGMCLGVVPGGPVRVGRAMASAGSCCIRKWASSDSCQNPPGGAGLSRVCPKGLLDRWCWQRLRAGRCCLCGGSVPAIMLPLTGLSWRATRWTADEAQMGSRLRRPPA